MSERSFESETAGSAGRLKMRSTVRSTDRCETSTSLSWLRLTPVPTATKGM